MYNKIILSLIINFQISYRLHPKLNTKSFCIALVIALIGFSNESAAQIFTPIDAVVDNTEAVNGLAGGTTSSLISNDTLDGSPAVIGNGANKVTLTGVIVPTGLTLNTNNGVVTVAPNTAAGSYSLTYRICQSTNGLNCDSVISTIVVSAPIIDAVADTTAAVNGLAGGTTSSLTSNDTLNGAAVVIGTAAGNVTLTGVDVPTGLTLNANGTVTVTQNTAEGNYSLTYKICEVNNTENCDSVVSTIVVSDSIIDAVADTTAAVNGLAGGTTSSLTSNDTLNGAVVVIGTAVGNVTLTGVNVPTGLTLNTNNGVVTVVPNTAVGSYSLTYKICEVNNTENCDSVVSTIVVSAPIIDAVADTTAAVNGLAGGTTSSLTSNDTLNGAAVVIGTAAGNVTLTGVDVPEWLTLNPDGTVTIAQNTPAVEFNLEYKICEVGFSLNCSSVISSILVSAKSPDFMPTIDISSLVFTSIRFAKDFVINISEICGAASEGQVVFNIQKTSAFKISYDHNAITSNVNGGVSVHNNKWEITENPFWITMRLKDSVVIGAHTFSTIGFRATLNPNVPNKTMQTITATIVDRSGSDGNSLNNTNSITVVVK
jgi:hypothetical protein